MSQIGDILQQPRFTEPPEIQIIKKFLRDNYQAECQVTVQERQIIIAVRGASLAGTLRLRLHKLQAMCQTDKRLTIRIV